MTGVLLRTVRNRGPWLELPGALATALLAPVRPPGTVPPPKPPRDWTAERAAASERLAAFASRALRARPRVAVIADAPAIDAYRADWDVVAIRPEDWFTVLTSDPPDLLVVDSARAGNGGAWTYRVAWTAHPDFFLLRDLRALVGWCAGRDIPAILRVREDVSRAPDWADAAALMDLVLVADAAAWDVFDGLRDRRGRIGRITALGAEGPAIVAAVRAGP